MYLMSSQRLNRVKNDILKNIIRTVFLFKHTVEYSSTFSRKLFIKYPISDMDDRLKETIETLFVRAFKRMK